VPDFIYGIASAFALEKQAGRRHYEAMIVARVAIRVNDAARDVNA
jgi:hypothetical protein